MTEEVNWVLARANCTLEGTFEEITFAIEADIKRFNDLPPKRRRERMFDSSPLRDTAFEVFRVARDAVGDTVNTGSKDRIIVQMTSVFITAKRTDHDPLTITSRWNEETLTCDLRVGGVPLSTWQISQKILGEFFFG